MIGVMMLVIRVIIFLAVFIGFPILAGLLCKEFLDGMCSKDDEEENEE